MNNRRALKRNQPTPNNVEIDSDDELDSQVHKDLPEIASEELIEESDIDSDASDEVDSEEETNDEADINTSNNDSSEISISESPSSSDEYDTDDVYEGKDGTLWSKTVPKKTQTAAVNKFTKKPGPKSQQAKRVNTVLESFELFMDDSIYEKIVFYTNKYLESIRSTDQSKRYKCNPTNVNEFKALFGLLFLLSSGRIGKGNIEYLWNNKTGRAWQITNAIMGFYRYSFLLHCIHFDDYEKRTESLKLDRFALVREIFEAIRLRFQQHYEPDKELCIDEQLLAYRGRVLFKQYIPSKPAKYGFKVWALVDVKSRYTLNLEPYVGKQPEVDTNGAPNVFNVNVAPFHLVQRLSKKYLKCGRNITGDNWFTSVPLLRELRKKKTFYVGTIRKNKREIPPEFHASKTREQYSSIFGFKKQMILVYYVPKKNKSVLLVSTQHHDAAIDIRSKVKAKPEIITFYNETKFGVDCVDQMCTTHSTARITRRWPLVHFFNLLNLSAINAQVIYKHNLKKKMSRSNFLNELGLALAFEELKRRRNDTYISLDTRRFIKTLPGLQENNSETLAQIEPLPHHK